MSKLLKRSKTIAIGLAFVILLVGLACARETKETDVTPPTDPLSVVNGYLEAFNAGDIAKLVTYYADDITSSEGPMPGGEFSTNTGIAEEMSHIAPELAEGAQTTISNATVEGNTVRADMWHTMPDLQAAGIDQLTGTLELVVEQGKIVSWKATLDEKSQREMAEAFGPPDPLSVVNGHREATVDQKTQIKEIALMIPIATGKTDDWIQTHKELMGPRYEGYAASKQRFGIESQVSFLQKTGVMGDFELLYMKGSDVKQIFENIATNQDEGSVYWRKLAGELHAVDFTQQQSSAAYPDSKLAFSMGGENLQNTQPFMFAIPVSSDRVAGLSSALTGERRAEYVTARENIGLKREMVFLQSGSAGEALIFYWRAEDPKSSLKKFMSSTDPFDVWLRSEIDGISPIGLKQLVDVIENNSLAVQYPRI